MDQVKNNLEELKARLQKVAQSIDQDKLKAEIRELEAQTMKENFWVDHDQAAKVSQTLTNKQKTLNSLENLESRINDSIELTTLPGIPLEAAQLQEETKQINKLLENLELQTYLSNPHDESEAILSVHSGTGGVEAMDWAAMLVRMYQRFFDKMGWKYDVTDEDLGEEAGIKTVSMIIHAPYAFGYLKEEAGTHRLVRQSPFNADHLRQTSFALVEVLPIISQTEVEICESDVEFEAFRSGGAGGQNVNKVSTAVRLRHIPTGLTVTAQTERSQLQNRENAMKLLMSKLWNLQQTQNRKQQAELKAGKTQASWGTQIRSYVLHPYHMVKDLRTKIATSDTDSVLNGELMPFIEAELRGRQSA